MEYWEEGGGFIFALISHSQQINGWRDVVKHILRHGPSRQTDVIREAMPKWKWLVEKLFIDSNSPHSETQLHLFQYILLVILKC